MQRYWYGITVLLLALLITTVTTRGQGEPGQKKQPNSDLEFVEKVIAVRKEYRDTLTTLRSFYIATGDLERARWAEEELIAFHRLPKRAFRLELDVPPPNLQGQYNIPEANTLLREAMAYKDKGGFGTALTDNMTRAELLLQQLLSKYPQSDKISDAAYHLGDIYESRTYRQYARAAAYFERCFQWNSKTHLDARLRAARLYERALNNRTRALQLYKEITTHEVDPERIQEAQRKMAELSGAR